MTTSTLFEITEEEQNNKLVWKNSDSNHSKAQKDFNSALAKHKATIAEAMLLDELVQIANTEYIKLVVPEIKNSKKLIALRTEMMRDIYLEELVNLGKNKKQLLKHYILEICSAEMQNDRDFYYAIILELETTSERNHRLAEKKRIEDQIKKQYGFEVDLEELNKKNFKSAEEQEAFNAKYKDFFEKFNENENKEFHDYYNGSNKKEKTKSKSEIDKEAKLAEVEKLLSTDINKLFKELAKLIHPDREQNIELRLKKESLMKELSNARDNSDIADILRIKMLVDELLPNNMKELSLNDSSIKRFVSIIKSKIKELENTIKQKVHSLPFNLNANVKKLDIKIIHHHIKKELNEIKFFNRDLEFEIDSMRNNPKFIKELILDYEIGVEWL